jgi:hypothetical protein
MRNSTIGIVLLAACGNVSNPVADAPPQDAAIDSLRGTVHVKVLDPVGNGSPAAATVVFFDPDGTPVTQANTDTSGNAQADVLPGGSVTAVAAVAGRHELTTVFGVNPGDSIVLGHKAPALLGTFAVTYPLALPPAVARPLIGFTGFHLAGPCGEAMEVIPGGQAFATCTLQIFDSCKQDTMELVVASTRADIEVNHSLDQKAVAFTQNGSVTLPDGQYTAPLSFTANYTSIDPNVTMQMVRATPDALGIGDLHKPTTAPAITVTFPGPIASTAAIETTVATALSPSSSQRVHQMMAGNLTSYALALQPALLPWLGEARFDATARKLVVPVTTDGTSTDKPDVFQVVTSYTRGADAFTWTFYAAEPGDITLPVLPGDLVDSTPNATDTVTAVATSIEADTIAGYDDLRHDLASATTLFRDSRNNANTVRVSSSQAIPKLANPQACTVHN